MTNFLTKWGKAAALLLGAFTAQQAQAAGVTAGTNVSNTASVTYTVGGPPITVNSNTSTFVVDRKIILTVAEVGGAATSVLPSTTGNITIFTVTNGSNSPLDINLTAANRATAQARAHTATGGQSTTDNQDVSAFTYVVDLDNSGTVNGAEAAVTHLDDVAADATVRVLVLATTPAGSNNEVATISLTGTAHTADGAATLGAIYAESGADTALGVENVLADIAGAAAGDGARDGKHSAIDDYVFVISQLTVVKSYRVFNDPFNGTTTPKAILGANVDYCLIVTNPPGGGTVTNIDVADVLPGATLVDYVAESIFTDVPLLAGPACDFTLGTPRDDNTTDNAGDEAGTYASYNAGTRTVSARIASLAANSSTGIRFRVTVK